MNFSELQAGDTSVLELSKPDGSAFTTKPTPGAGGLRRSGLRDRGDSP